MSMTIFYAKKANDKKLADLKIIKMKNHMLCNVLPARPTWRILLCTKLSYGPFLLVALRFWTFLAIQVVAMTHDSLPKSAFSHLPQDFFAKKNLFLFYVAFFLNLLFTLRNKKKKANICKKAMIIVYNRILS